MNRSPEKPKQKGGFAAAGKIDEGEDQVLRLTNERFIVPELLFQPGIIGALQKHSGFDRANQYK